MTLVPLALLSFLGWRVLEQDRQLERQQIQQRLELAADVVVAALQRTMAADVQRLAADERQWPEGAVAVSFGGSVAVASPKGRVAYLPAVQALREAPAGTFAEGEALEFRGQDRGAAVRFFRVLAKSNDSAVRAGALLRLGRSLRALGLRDEALDTYARLAGIEGVSVDGVPAGLAAGYARATLFEGEGRTADLRAEAQSLDRDLRSGRWALTAPVYLLYARDAARWRGGASQARSPDAEIFAEAVQAVWQRRGAMAASGQAALSVSGQSLTVLWHTSSDAFRALIVTQALAESRWFASAQLVAAEHRIALELRDATGKACFGALGTDVTNRTVRKAGDTGLPWDAAVAGDGASEWLGTFAQRRRLLVAGFAVLVALSLVAGILILRAVGRELAVGRMKSDFVAAVSHEFRTPLTSLRQFTDMLRGQEDLTDERRRICYDAQSRATDRLTRLVESLLDFGRMEAGARPYRFARGDGAELAARAVEEFRRDAQTAGCEIQFTSDGPAPIEADDEALARAVRNLLDNAVKYSPEHRAIAVTTERRGAKVLIAVRDHGMGIASDERDAILTTFHRGEQARRLGIPGTGIGLAMVQHIVNAHGGQLQIDSEPGHGSTFTIVLPAKE